MESEFQDQEQLGQYLRNWLTPRGVKCTHSFFSGEDKKYSAWEESLFPEVSIIKTRLEKELYPRVVWKF